MAAAERGHEKKWGKKGGKISGEGLGGKRRGLTSGASLICVGLA